MKKETYEEHRKRLHSIWWYNRDNIRKKLLWWLKAPCRPEDCYRGLTHRHFTCLTCPARRYRTQGRDSGYQTVPYIHILIKASPGSPIILPKHFMPYSLIIRTRKDGSVPKWKAIPLKFLMTVAERIAEW